MPTIVDVAHSYARRGWRVIELHRAGGELKMCSCAQGGRCKSAGKHPKAEGWQKLPRMSGPDIQATWDVEKPPNIGIATGSESGIWVLDLDPEHGAVESMQALIAAHGGLPETRVHETGSGGWHYIWEMPPFELRNTQGKLGQGIDTRATGGQIVAPPSISDKGTYSVLRDVDPVQAPGWLLDLLKKDDLEQVTAESLPRPEEIAPDEWARLNGYASKAIAFELQRLDKLKETGWDGEPWNATTFQVSCSLLEFANSPWCSYSTGQANADVLKHAPRDPGFDDWTVQKTFDSARSKVGVGARAVPENRTPRTSTPLADDPLFGGPDVRNPTEGGGAEANPAAGQGGRKYPWREFFGGEKGTTPLHKEMSLGVFDRGPVGWGLDNDFWEYADGYWRPRHYVVEDRMVLMLGNAFKTAHVTNTKPIVRVHAQQISADPLESVMNFQNAMVDWRTGDLFDHDPSYGSTIQLGTVWDPEATCPHFDDFLAEVLLPDYIELAWEMIGYLMMSGNPKQLAFLLYGKGGNGKGTLLRVISDLLGRQNIASETLDDLTGNRFRAASLFGRIANIAGDLDATYQESTAMFKRLTGEDTVTGEHKGLKPFQFESWAVPLFSCNKFPGSADVTDGYLRRWLILHFHAKIDKTRAIDGLSSQLVNELPGIAQKGVRALRAMMDRGRFEPRGEAIKGQEEFAMAVDQVRQWVASGQVSAAPHGGCSLSKLYQAYVLWTERSGKRKVNEGEFSDRLDSMGYKAQNTAGIVHHEGITVPEVGVQQTTPANFFGVRSNDEED